MVPQSPSPGWNKVILFSSLYPPYELCVLSLKSLYLGAQRRQPSHFVGVKGSRFQVGRDTEWA